MKLKSRDGERILFAGVHWLPRCSSKSSDALLKAVELIEEELLRLWRTNPYRPESDESAGLVFPADEGTLGRVRTEPPGKVQVGYVVADGEIVAGMVLHIDNAIGGYANGSVGWATKHFKVEREQVAFIRSLVVSPNARGFGIGRLLLRQTIQRAKLLGAQVVISHLRVSPGMDQGLDRAYREAGFSDRSDAVTMMIRRSRPNQWVEVAQTSPYTPCGVEDLPPDTTEIAYVCVGTRCVSNSRNEVVTA